MFNQLVGVVQFLHDKEIVHRDIKLDNLLYDKSIIKLLDFGFSLRIDPEQLLSSFVGTPYNMSPEIINRSPHQPKPADVWAMGVVLFEMLTGKTPFTGVSEAALFQRIKRGKFKFPRYISKPAKNLITQMLDVDPEKRPTAQ